MIRRKNIFLYLLPTLKITREARGSQIRTIREANAREVFRDLSRSYRTHARGLRRSSRVLRRSIDADSFSTQPLAQALENHPVCLSRFDLFPRLSPTQLSVETKESNKNSRDVRGILNISFEIPQIRSP